MRKIFLPAIAIIAILFAASCEKEKNLSNYTDRVTCNEADDTANVYSGKIAPLLNANCASSGCHNSLSREDGKDYSNYNSAKSAFDAEALCTIYQESGCEAMPRGRAKLSDDVIHDLTCWVKNGYPQ